MIKTKNKHQIEKIRKSCVVASETIKYLQQFMVAGVKTRDLDKLAFEFMQKAGAKSACLGYPMGKTKYAGHICTSVNEYICHESPSSKELKDGDIIGVDVCVELDGYIGDTCYTYEIGNISQEAKDLVEATKKSLEIGINAVKIGGHFGNIGYEIKKYIEPKGYSIVKALCGHGVGLKLHEDPQIFHTSDCPNCGAKIKKGMVFTIEPMINLGTANIFLDQNDYSVKTLDNKLSAQFEHTIAITDKVEILTSFP